jgi:hypothetical protein
MSGTFLTIAVTLGSDVANGGTFTASYPTGFDAGAFTAGYDHQVVSNGYGTLKATAGDISVSFGASAATITNNAGTTMLAGTELTVQLDQAGGEGGEVFADEDRMAGMRLIKINLGAPDAIDVDGVFEAVSQAAGSITLDGALASGGVVTFDVPRNIVVDSGGVDTSAITFTGTDAYGNTVVETITLNGTTAVAGKKAFKTITAAANAATISNGAFAGPGDVLGLPVFLPATGDVISEQEDGVEATAGTLAAGVGTTATATTGDVRGTYDPNSACDGSKSFQLLVAVGDPSYKGVAQYAG